MSFCDEIVPKILKIISFSSGLRLDLGFFCSVKMLNPPYLFLEKSFKHFELRGLSSRLLEKSYAFVVL